MVEGEQFLNKSLDEGKSVMAEGAQGTLLDVDFGSYPLSLPPIPLLPVSAADWGSLPTGLARSTGYSKHIAHGSEQDRFLPSLMDEDGALSGATEMNLALRPDARGVADGLTFRH